MGAHTAFTKELWGCARSNTCMMHAHQAICMIQFSYLVSVVEQNRLQTVSMESKYGAMAAKVALSHPLNIKKRQDNKFNTALFQCSCTYSKLKYVLWNRAAFISQCTLNLPRIKLTQKHHCCSWGMIITGGLNETWYQGKKKVNIIQKKNDPMIWMSHFLKVWRINSNSAWCCNYIMGLKCRLYLIGECLHRNWRKGVKKAIILIYIALFLGLKGD